MSSSSRQEQLAAQIATLQAQLAEEKAKDERKRKATQHIRVAASPSPTKKRKISHQTFTRVSHAPPRISQPVFSRTTHNHASNAASNTQKRVSSPAVGLAHNREAPKTRQSNLAASLTAYHAAVGDSDANAEEPVGRRPALYIDRNADLTLVESLQIGPLEHAAPTNDLLFKTIEPYSKINLRSRSLDYEDEQEFLRGRYYVSPSMLYSIVRLSPNRQGYDVPVDGDWVTIAVIAERGDISVSRGAKTGSEDQDDGGLEASREKSKGDGMQKRKKPSTSKHNACGKKYMTLRLVDFGRRHTDPQTGKISIGGDALLNLILFEADSYSAENTAAGATDRVYKGGSGGAFENATLLRAGAVIAVMSAKILKPFQRGTDKPHPTDNILALTPTDAKSIVIIGQSKDLGKCPALKRDGTPCGSWCDRRVSEVCDYHVQRAVQSRRAARPEFASSTSGMSTSAKPSPRDGYDPSRKWGLLPAAGMNPAASKTSASLGGGTTYVMPGVVVSSQRDKTLSEVMGRERHDRKRRQAEKETQERELAKLIEKDGGKTGGAKAVAMARQALAAKRSPLGPKSKGNVTANEVESKGSDSKTYRRVFSAMAVKRIGFDPSAKSGSSERRHYNDRVNRILENLTTENTGFKLGHMPGPRIRSGVFPPAPKPLEGADEPQDQGTETCTLLPRAEDSDDDLWVV